MRKTFLTILACVLALVVSTGCDEVQNKDFGGVIGFVGLPPIGNCQVDIYNALSFESLDSNAGLIKTTSTNSAGRFSSQLNDRHLGRPLIIVARPGPDAMYRDFGAPGNPDVVWDDPRRPWVSVLQEWLGGEDYVTVSPITTVAFQSLMHMPVEQVGGGRLRFDVANVSGANRAAGANFGISTDPAGGAILPPSGSAFESQKVSYLEDNDRAQSYAYATLQLALAANDFAANSPDPTDSALDFYDALFRDAQDGVLDGQYFGAPIPHLNQIPAVVGREAGGASSLMNYVSTHSLSAVQENFVTSARDGQGYDTTPGEIATLMADATGSLRRTRIDSFDVRNYPYSGNVVMTIRGEGFRRTDRFVFRSRASSSAEFIVDRDSVGVDGEFQHHSDGELRMRIPDFATTTRSVPPALQVASGSNFRIVRLILENRPRIKSTSSDVEHELTDDARVTDRTEPLLVNAKIGRIDAGGELSHATAGNNIYDAATDPGGLDPALDDVYELRVRVVNPGPDAIDNVGLSLPLSAFRQLGAMVVPDTFGGSATGRAVIFESALPTANLGPGDIARLDYRFVFLDSAVPGDLIEGAPVGFTPVLSGVSQGAGNPTLTTSDVVGFNRTASLAPVDPDATPELDALPVPVLPAAVTAGDEFEIELDLGASPRSGANMRGLDVIAIEVTIDFDGETTVLHLADAFFETPGEAGLKFTRLVRQGTGGRAMPVRLTQVAPAGTIVLTVQTDPSRTGTLTASYTATGIDPATRVVTTQASASDSTTITP